MLQDETYRVLEDSGVVLVFTAKSGFTFLNRNIPIILSFRERETLFGIHIQNEDFGEVGAPLGTPELISLRVLL